jgi:hypothetical protein
VAGTGVRHVFASDEAITAWSASTRRMTDAAITLPARLKFGL